MFKRFGCFLAALMLCVGAAVARGETALPMWLSEGPDVPEMPRFPDYAYADGLLRLEGFEDALRVSVAYFDAVVDGEDISHTCEMRYDEARGAWYSEEAASQTREPFLIQIETENRVLCRYKGGMAQVSILESGEPRYEWSYWAEPFEGMSQADAPFISVTIYPQDGWPYEACYSGKDVLSRYIYTAADGARVRYESYGLFCVTLERDGQQYAYAPDKGFYPKGWSMYTGDVTAFESGYTPCDPPEGAQEANYGPLIDQKAWEAAVNEAFAGS